MKLRTFDFSTFEPVHKVVEDSLQGTDEWFEKRRGRFTGSKIKDLMSSGRSTGKKSWTEGKEKLFDFGKPAEKYIYAVGKERTTGRLSMEVTSKQMDYGKEHEPLLIKKLLEDGVITDFVGLDFEQFPSYENAGASIDGIAITGPNAIKHKIQEGLKVGLEIKCPVSWDGHYNRMYEEIHEKHDDFWQFQAEMLATETNLLLYVVALPMTVEEYDVEITAASKIHQKAMLDRCKIADKAISLWPKHKYSEALAIAIAEFKDDESLIEA